MMTLLWVLLACKGCEDEAPLESFGCPESQILPTETCAGDRDYLKLVCASCDPLECANCPTYWYCTRSNNIWHWQGGDSIDCDCIGDDGYLIQTPECTHDSDPKNP